MGVTKNAAKDFVGEVQQNAGAAAGDKDVEDAGSRKRREAQDQEQQEQRDENFQEEDYENIPEGGMAQPDFEKSSSRPVEDVTHN